MEEAGLDPLEVLMGLPRMGGVQVSRQIHLMTERDSRCPAVQTDQGVEVTC